MLSFPLRLAVLRIGAVPHEDRISDRVEGDCPQPTFMLGLGEHIALEPFEYSPVEEWVLVRYLGCSVRSQKPRAAFLENLHEPCGSAALGFCDRARPQAEGVPLDVLLSRFQKALPRDSPCLPVSFPASHL